METETRLWLSSGRHGTFTTQVYLNKSEHICRLVPRSRGGEAGRQRGAGRVCVVRTRLQEGWLGLWGSAGPWCWMGSWVSEPSARRSFLSLTCSPLSP